MTNRIILVGIMVCIALFLGGIFGGVGTAQAQTDYSTAPDCSTVSYNGSGTSSDPYEVSDPYTLQCIGNSSDTTFSEEFEIISDINLSETENWNSGKGFEPIGSFDPVFNGTFNGNGYNIDNLYIDRNGKAGIFFKTGTPSEIHNINITNVDINASSKVGALASIDQGTIKNVVTTGEINSTKNTGGIVGFKPLGELRNSSSNVDISGHKNNNFGGLVGDIQDVNITNSYATGSVTVVGEFSATVGGLVGYSNGGDITNSYATGNVSLSGSSAEIVGGLVGEIRTSGTITNSYATGNVSGPNSGGLIAESEGTITDSYWDTETSGQTTSDGGTALNTDQMTGDPAKTNMTGFDFTNNWSVINKEDGYTADGYPILQSLNEGTQLSVQSISTLSYYDLTVNVSHNSSDVDTDYEILNSSDTVVASGNTGSDGTVTENLVEGTYDVKLAHNSDQYSNITTTVTLDADKTVSESLTVNSYDLTFNATDNGTSVDTDYEIEDSSGTVVASGNTGSDGTVTETLNYGTYDIVLAQNDTSYNTTTKTTTVDSDKTVAVSLSKSYYTVSIKADDSTGGVNTTYAFVNTSNQVVVSGTTNNSSYIDISLVVGDYDIEIAHGDSNYTNTTDTITLDQDVQKTYNLTADSGGGGLFGDSGSGGILLVGVVISVAGFAIVSGSSTGRKRRGR